jgi:uncharacterized OB-fold protein
MTPPRSTPAKLAYRKELYAVRKAAGVCPNCGQRRAPDRVHCPACLRRSLERNREVRRQHREDREPYDRYEDLDSPGTLD